MRYRDGYIRCTCLCLASNPFSANSNFCLSIGKGGIGIDTIVVLVGEQLEGTKIHAGGVQNVFAVNALRSIKCWAKTTILSSGICYLVRRWPKLHVEKTPTGSNPSSAHTDATGGRAFSTSPLFLLHFALLKELRAGHPFK